MYGLVNSICLRMYVCMYVMVLCNVPRSIASLALHLYWIHMHNIHTFNAYACTDGTTLRPHSPPSSWKTCRERGRRTTSPRRGTCGQVEDVQGAGAAPYFS